MIDGKPLDGHRARRAHRGRHLPGTFGPGIALLDNVHLVAEAQATRRRSTAGTFAQALGVADAAGGPGRRSARSC